MQHPQLTQKQQQPLGGPAVSPQNDDETVGDGSSAMPEEVFKWMAHTVNQDFLCMGYPAVLTKSGDQEFVNLCPLISNCTSILTLLKARRRAPGGDDEASVSGAVGGDNKSAGVTATSSVTSATAAASTATSSTVNTRRKRRKWGLFSSKQQRRKAAGRHHQQQHQQQQQKADAKDILHESMARKMRKDTERIIRRTACLDLRAPSGNCPPSPYATGTPEHQDFTFMHLTWRSFRKLAQARILECTAAVKRSEELQREISNLTVQLDRLRAAAVSGAAPAAVEDTASLTSASAVGRLQRVGGFLRRAVSKERLTFGRKLKVNDSGAEGNTATPESSGITKRSRSCSLPPGGLSLASPATMQPPLPASDLETEFRRMRAEFERRERLLLSEREKLRQINSKLNFRVQHLSSVATASKQNGSNSGGSGGGGGCSTVGSGGGGCGSSVRGCSANSKDVDFHQRRLERRAAALQKEVASLKHELNDRIDSLTGIGVAVAKFSKAAAAADEGVNNNDKLHQQDAACPELPTDVALVPQLVDSVCHTTLGRLQRLRKAQLDAQSKAASIGDCLQLVQRRLGLTQGAVENTRAMEVELETIAARLASARGAGRAVSISTTRRCSFNADTRSQVRASAEDAADEAAAYCGDQDKLVLRDRIIGKLTAMLRERQEEVRRLKEISVSCQDVSSRACSIAGASGHLTSAERMSRAAGSFR